MSRIAVVHADESCLGNGRDGENPGGAGALIEVRLRGAVARRDFTLAAADTTNNRMALSGAVAVLQLLAGKGRRLRVAYVSDSQYLVRGMNEWVAGWRARGWKRKGGAIENLEIWKELVDAAAAHDVSWMWVRGHHGHPKNEYADHLAVRAAETQDASADAVESQFSAWLDQRREKGQFTDYDPDAAFTDTASQLTDRP